MSDILTYLKDAAITGAAGVGLTMAVAMVLGAIKKGKLEQFGFKCGLAVSKLANARIGKAIWEKVEDVITLSILSFAKGFKLGADDDDDPGEGK